MQGDLDWIALGGDDAKRLYNGKLKLELVAKGGRHQRFGAPSLTFVFQPRGPIVVAIPMPR
jgi:hypothetical protein